jgi:hypothetical protein
MTKPNIRIITAQEIREENELFLKAMAEEAAKGTKALSAYECHMLTVKQEGKEQTLPACDTCWRECIDSGLTILSASPVIREPPQPRKEN